MQAGDPGGSRRWRRYHASWLARRWTAGLGYWARGDNSLSVLQCSKPDADAGQVLRQLPTEVGYHGADDATPEADVRGIVSPAAWQHPADNGPFSVGAPMPARFARCPVLSP
jgi:hypothetical protein